MGLLGCLIFVVADVAASLIVGDYSPISETISDLAAGQRSWILDTGMQLFAVSIVACAVGLYTWKLGELRWRLGSILLLLCGVDIFIIASHNAYGDGVPTGVEIHIYLVYFLGIAFGATCLLLAAGLGRVGSFWSRSSVAIAIIWFVLAPIFFFVPTAWNGAYERFLGLILLTWFVSVCWLLIQRRNTPLNM